MKRFLSILLALAMMLSLMSNLVFAADVDVDTGEDDDLVVDFPELTEPALGTENNPIQINEVGEFAVEVAAGETVYYAINAMLAQKFVAVLDGAETPADITVTVDDVELDLIDGAYWTLIQSEGAQTKMVVTNNGTTDVALTGEVALQGTSYNPIVVNAYDFSVEAAAGKSTYYMIPADFNGNVLTIAEDEGMTVTLNGAELTAADGLYQAELTGAPVNALVVTAADADVSGTAAIEAKLGTETNPIEIIYAEQLTGVEAAAGTSTYYAISSTLNGQVLTIAGIEGMTVTLNGTALEADWEGIYQADLTGTPTNMLVVTAGEADVAVPANINYPIGSESNPYVINSTEDMAYGPIAAGETVYVAIASSLAGKELTLSAGYTADAATVLLNGTELTGDAEGGYKAILDGSRVIPLLITNNGEEEISFFASVAEPAGSAANPYTVNETVTYTIPAGTTYHFVSDVVGGTITVGETVYEVTEGFTFTIENTSDAPAEYEIVVTYPLGSMENPEAVEFDGTFTATLDESNSWSSDQYNYTYTAPADGTITIKVTEVTSSTEGAAANIVVLDEEWNSYSTLDGDIVIEVTEGQVFTIWAETQAVGMMQYPAANVTWSGTFEAAGPAIDENLKFQTIGLSFQDYIGVDFVVTEAAFGAYDEVYVEAVQTDPSAGDTKETLQGTNLGTAMKRYQKEVLSWSMAETITVTLYGVKDGVVTQGVTVVTSVEELALAKIGDYATANNTKACTALVNMLNYGAAVQVGYSHNADYLPNGKLEEMGYAQYATVEEPSFTAENSSEGTGTISVRTNSVSMQSKVEIQFAFMNVDVSPYELRYTVNGVTSSIAGSDFTVQGPFKTAKIAVKAADMRAVYTVALYDPATGEAVTPVYTVSVEAYAKGQVGGTYDAVVKALLKYGDSVAALAS